MKGDLRGERRTEDKRKEEENVLKKNVHQLQESANTRL